MRDRRLLRIKAVVKRKQRVTAKCADHRLVLDREDRLLRHRSTRRNIGHRGPLSPLGDRLLVRRENDPRDRFLIRFTPIALHQRSQALLTMLYRLTDACAAKQSPGLFSVRLALIVMALSRRI